MPANKAAKKIKIPKSYTSRERKAIAEDIIEYIRERSSKGKGPGNRKWSGKAGKYSDEYEKSLEFKIAGKSKTKVNQRLEGDMLTEMEVIGTTPGEIQYGYSFANEEHGKAKGNILGTYGQKSPVKGKARDFLELTNAEVKKILDRYPLRDAEEREKATSARLRALELVRRGLGGEDD